MQFEIKPYVGIGPITFGLERTKVRQQLAAPVESFKKTPNSATPSDAFDTLGIHVHYDSNERCESVEFGGLLSKPSFQPRQMLGQPFAEIESWLRSLDPDARSDSTGLTSLKYGFGLYAPSASEDPQSAIEGVIVFRRGYYDEDS